MLWCLIEIALRLIYVKKGIMRQKPQRISKSDLYNLNSLHAL